MPSPEPSLTRADAFEIAERCFKLSPPGEVGIELEWIPYDIDDWHAAIDFAAIESTCAALGELPGGGGITFEPGGQIELSSRPASDLAVLSDEVATDIDILERAMSDIGIRLIALGIDPIGRRERVLRVPRYAAMEAYFDHDGPDGRTMMLSTASLQVNLNTGLGTDLAKRWRRAHVIGPLMVASFANSPDPDGSGAMRSARQGVWQRIDGTRTRPPAIDAAPQAAWFEYALEARVMCIRRSPQEFEPITDAFTFDEWIERGSARGYPTAADFEYHLTTLFPPVRPRGWLEFRMIDSLPSPWWRVPAALASALLDDEVASAEVDSILENRDSSWLDAARRGLSDPDLAKAARLCFEAAIEALPRLRVDEATSRAVVDFYEEFVANGKSLADACYEAAAGTSGVTAERLLEAARS